MKKLILGLLVIAILISSFGLAAKGGKNAGCTQIQSGELTTTDGETLTTGYSEWGYNYQAYMYNGLYCNYHPLYRPGGPYADWCWANYGDVKLMMKWNDAWLDNKDCDGDGLLDRHYGSPVYEGSGAWLTNHITGTNEDGTKWTYFTKIVAKPAADFDCASVGGVQIWGAFCTIQNVVNDPSTGEHGVQLLVNPAGFGAWK